MFTSKIRFIFFQTLQIRELKNKDLLNVAKKLTTQFDIHCVGEELGLDYEDIAKHITNNRTDITMAAYQMLRAWRVTEEHAEEAFSSLVTALQNASFHHIITETLQ